MVKRRRLISRRDREFLLREKVMDLGNIIFSGLLISQIFRAEFNFWIGFSGVLVTIVVYASSYKL